MIKSYFKIALRNLIKSKTYSFVNIFGLAIGLACCLLIFLYIQDELSYDNFHKKSDNIYRILSAEPGEQTSARTPYRLGPKLKNSFPEINQYVRITWPWSELVTYKNKNFNQNVIYTDSTFFKVFSFNLLKGDPENILNVPNQIVITKNAAIKFFGKEEPLGKTIFFNKEDEFVISGIMDDIPPNSHIQFDILAPISLMSGKFGEQLERWGFEEFYTYLLLSDKSNYTDLESKFPDFIKNNIGEERNAGIMFPLQPFNDIHLFSSHLAWDITVHGNASVIYIFSIIAVFVLLIACFNYMNLTTARSVRRAKEIGIRKVVGASRNQIRKQFLGESIFLTFLSLLLAMVITEILLPYFNTIVNKNLSIGYFENIPFLIILVLVMIFTGLFAGSFPAFFISSFETAGILKDKLKTSKASVFKKGLVVIQFSISTGLIVCVIVIGMQLHFLNTTDLGFKKDNLVVISMIGTQNKRGVYKALKNDLIKNPGIFAVSASSSVPPHKYNYTSAQSLEGSVKENHSVKFFCVDFNFIETMEMKFVSGRNFSKIFITDENEALIINESFVRELGWNEPVGKRLHVNSKNISGKIIGVVKDFHFKTLREKIEPAVFYIDFNSLWNLIVRIDGRNTSDVLEYIKTEWEKYEQAAPFNYSFVDKNFEQRYNEDKKTGSVIGFFTLLAILIASLGILGLVSLSTEYRYKEIGIRKVLGASVTSIVGLFSLDFIKLIVTANFIAFPIAYYFMYKWLQDFAYRIEINWWMFASACAGSLLLVLITISLISFRAANADPVKSLKYE